MVEDYFDNSPIVIAGDNAIELIKSYIASHLPNLKVATENYHAPFWNIRLTSDSLVIDFEGDVGFSVDISIDGKKLPLYTYDRRVVNAVKTNRKNLLFNLDVLSSFVNGL